MSMVMLHLIFIVCYVQSLQCLVFVQGLSCLVFICLGSVIVPHICIFDTRTLYMTNNRHGKALKVTWSLLYSAFVLYLSVKRFFNTQQYKVCQQYQALSIKAQSIISYTCVGILFILAAGVPGLNSSNSFSDIVQNVQSY